MRYRPGAAHRKRSLASANYVGRRIPVGRNPRGVVLSPDGKRLYVANRMDDNITVIDTNTDKVVSTFDLGGPKDIDAPAPR